MDEISHHHRYQHQAEQLSILIRLVHLALCICRYKSILENIEGRVQRYYNKKEPRLLIPQLVPNDSLNKIVESEDR